MNDMIFAIAQLDSTPGQIQANIANALHFGREAFERGADFVLFHEGLTADYTADPVANGCGLDGPEVQQFIDLAGEFNGIVVPGINEVSGGVGYLSMVFCSGHGVIGTYRKSYLWPNDSQCRAMGHADYNAFKTKFDNAANGYRDERAVLGRGHGTVVLEINGLRIGCLICADGSQDAAWQTFRKDRPDVIFWQNNRGTAIRDGLVARYAAELHCPILASNRVGYSWEHRQMGGSCICAADGHYAAKANENYRQEIITCRYSDLI